MGVISVSLPADGSTADVADYNTPITTITNEINGNLDNANIKTAAAIDGSKLADSAITAAKIADATITNAKLATTTGEPGGAWQAWTPVWTSTGTAPAIGNGTLTGAHKQIGKTLHFRIKFVAGSTTTFGTGTYFITLPVAPYSGVAANDGILLGGYCEDNGVAVYHLIPARMFDTTKVYIYIMRASDGASFSWSATTPFTWATGDYWSGTGMYEVA